jgi:hypothetical protein
MTLPADPEPGAPRRRSALVRWVPLLAALAVVLVVVGVVAAVRGGGSSGEPPVLNLAGGGDLAVAAAPSDAAGQVVLVGTLPADGPSHARVYRYADSAAPADRVRALVKALGLKATPVRHGANWQAQGSDSSLTVGDRNGQRWTYGPGTCNTHGDVASCSSSGSGVALPPTPATAKPNGPIECIKAPCPGPGYTPPTGTLPDQPTDPVKPTTPTGTAPDLATATSVVAPVFRAAGLDPAKATHQSFGGSISFTASPEVDGKEIVGAETSVVVGANNVIMNAGGVLGTAAAGDTYPLVSAKTAFERLRTAPHPDICRLDPATGGCANAEPTVVTGARPGLMFTVDRDGKALLVPAWLFTVKNGGAPLAALALPDKYLAKPPGVANGPNQAASSAPGGSPSQVEPAPPQSTSSVAAPGPVTGGAYPILSVSASGSTLGVTYESGPGNPCTNPVQPQVQETSTTVTVTVRKALRKTGVMCPQYVQEGPFVTSVTLKAPLGGRAVVDGSNGARPKVVTR